MGMAGKPTIYGDLEDGLLLLYPYYHESGICEPTEVHMDLYGSYDRNSIQIPMINKAVYRIHVDPYKASMIINYNSHRSY